MLKNVGACMVAAAAVTAFGSAVTSAQSYPTRPIRIITASAGGGSDFVARLVAQGISEPLGQPVIVVNYPTGPIPGETTARATPDGHTLMVTGQVMWVGSLLRPARYDPLKDFAPITILVAAPSVLAVTPSLPVKSVSDLIALAKAKPGELNYANAGTGSLSHLAAELFKHMAGINIRGVPYSSPSARLAEAFSGQVQVLFDDGLMPHIRSGKLRGLGVTSSRRNELAPGLPTVAEAGVPGYESVLKTGLFAPAGTPTPIIERVNRETVRFLTLPETKSRLFDFGTEVVASSPAELAATVKQQRATFAKVFEAAGIKAE
jgi:tripartite-type tricarboxylate transporter receptor subunit TctC